MRPGRRLYIATNERTAGFFEPLRQLYRIFQLSDFQYLWGPGSTWEQAYREMFPQIANVQFDSYMQV